MYIYNRLYKQLSSGDGHRWLKTHCLILHVQSDCTPDSYGQASLTASLTSPYSSKCGLLLHFTFMFVGVKQIVWSFVFLQLKNPL